MPTRHRAAEHATRRDARRRAARGRATTTRRRRTPTRHRRPRTATPPRLRPTQRPSARPAPTRPPPTRPRPPVRTRNPIPTRAERDRARRLDPSPRGAAPVSTMETPPTDPNAIQPGPPERRCPRCGSTLAPDQEWCLSCGAAAGTEVVEASGWRVPLYLGGGLAPLAVIGVILAIVALASQKDEVAQNPTPSPGASAAPPGADAESAADLHARAERVGGPERDGHGGPEHVPDARRRTRPRRRSRRSHPSRRRRSIPAPGRAASPAPTATTR